MEQSVGLGIGGIETALGAHICAFYHGCEGRDALMIPFLEEGIRNGEKCIALIDSSEPEHVWSLLPSTEVRADPEAPPQVVVARSSESYVRGGHFNAEEMIGWLTEQVSACLGAEGFPRVRAAGEMSWALPDCPGVGEVFSYEARINKFALRFPQVLLCLYDLDRVSGSMVIDAMKTHPRILLGGLLLDCPYYVDPDQVAGDGAPPSNN